MWYYGVVIESYEVMLEIARQGGVGVLVPYGKAVVVTPVVPIPSLYYHPDEGVRAAYLAQEMMKVHKRIERFEQMSHELDNDED